MKSVVSGSLMLIILNVIVQCLSSVYVIPRPWFLQSFLIIQSNDLLYVMNV